MDNKEFFIKFRKKCFNENKIRIYHQTNSNSEEFNKLQVNNIIFNDKMHLVANFKNFLILDDSSEFMKR
jgi:hypothetical protein